MEIRAIVNGGRRRGNSSEYVIDDNTHTLSLGLCCCCALMKYDRAVFRAAGGRKAVDRKALDPRR